METSHRSRSELFQQLGLPHEDEEIELFIIQNRPLPAGQLLCDAPFWSPQQAQFLREGMAQDAVWVVAIDDLNRSLCE